MQQRTDARQLVEQGEGLLLHNSPREAAAAFSTAVQADPADPAGHLGLAEANFALGAFGIVNAAARQVLQLVHEGFDASLAQALLYVIEQRYDLASQELDRSVSLDPTRAYAHALRGYVLRRLGNAYDGSLAEARAARQSGNREISALFPSPTPAVAARPSAPPTGAAALGSYPNPASAATAQNNADTARPWNQRSAVERQVVRVNFLARGTPIVTYTLIVLNVAIYVACAVLSKDFITPVTDVNNPIYNFGIQQGSLMQHDPIQFYRIFTAMFLHYGIAHIGLNMISLLSVGVITERIFGRGRFLLIYFVGGILGGLAQAFITPDTASLGASGAIFAIFGAFGAFALLRRRSLGNAGNSILGQWIFFLALNLYFSFSNTSTIGAWDHLGGLAAGLIIGAVVILMTSSRQRRSSGGAIGPLG